MKKFIIILLLQWPISLASGQRDPCIKIVDQRSLFEVALTGQSYQMERTIGSQLFMDGSFKGDIILASGDTVRNKLIGYNGFLDELIWTMPDNMSLIRVDKEHVDKFILYNINDQQNVVFRLLHRTTTGNKQIDFFAQILLEDTLSLYATRNSEVVDKIEKKTGNIITFIDRIEPVPPVYYIGLPDNKFLIINLRKKSLYNTLPDSKEAIKTLLIQHHQPLRNENDLIRVVKLLNENGIIK